MNVLATDTNEPVGDVLPRRKAGMCAMPVLRRPMEMQDDLGLLRAVLDGLHRLDAEGRTR